MWYNGGMVEFSHGFETIKEQNNLGKLVLMRHGQTAWSKIGRYTGRTNLPLTAIGRKQARFAGSLLNEYNFNGSSSAKQIFVSPLRRAQETAKQVGYTTFQTSQALAEWDYGSIEGHTREQLSALIGHDYNIWIDGININTSSLPIPKAAEDEEGNRIEIAHLPGESLAAVSARARRFVDQINMTVQSKQDVLVIAHSQILRVIACTWLGIDPKNGGKLVLDTASISTLGIVNGLHCIFDWNKTVPIVD
ncbi:MAG: histidine phosphatase family protein [Candidatus Ancillula sp.]|nr:histidine phosphatase family protein [Candidatus Ancillula sp.]